MRPAARALLATPALLAVTLLLAGCSAPQVPSSPGVTTTTSTPAPTAVQSTAVQPIGEPTILASGLTTPWSVVPLSTGSSLISERDTGLVKELTADGGLREVGAIPGVAPGGEGGLLGLAVEADEQWLSVFFTSATDNRIVRFALDGEPGDYRIGAGEELLTGLPKAGNHNGGRLGFGPDGMLYATAGDAGQPDGAQDPAFLGGKILRIEPDGGIPNDNPFAASPVWSLGHRNPQGIAWDADGQLWAAEFGQSTWDEFNRIEPGANYGWPVVEGAGGVEGFVDPVYQWPTSEASPSGLAFTSETFFLAALRGQRVWALYTEGVTAAAVPWFVGTHGRIRDAVSAPDGSLWLLTSNTDRNGSSPAGGDALIRYELGTLVGG